MDFFEYNTSFDIEEFLQRSQENEQQRLEEELERIHEQLERREQIHQETIDELESKRDWYIERLELLYRRGSGKHGKRKQLKNRIEQLYEALRDEKRSHWLDKQSLEQERRELLRSLGELTDDSIQDLL